MVLLREPFQCAKVLAVLTAFLRIPIEAFRPRQEELGYGERWRPIPIPFKREEALKFKQIRRGIRGGSTAENVFAEVSLKLGIVQIGIVAEFTVGKALDPRQQRAIWHSTLGQRVHGESLAANSRSEE